MTMAESQLQAPDLTGPDPAAEFGRLYEEYAAPLHRYLARRIGEQTAYDLVGETFEAALRNRHAYDPARAVVRAWLFGIATNLLRRHLRQEVRGLRAVASAGGRLDRDAGHELQVADRLDAQAMARRLAPALAALSDSDRDVLLLTAWAGLSAAEVAEALGIPVGTVYSRLHRVRRQLRARAATPLTNDPGVCDD
jgi:RNA polymerase sigma factor (sigma-70 family)